MKSLTACWENYLKIQHDERVIAELTVLIIAPDVFILVENAPKSLAAGAPPQNPLGSIQRSRKPSSCYGLAWRFGGQLCAPSLVTGATPAVLIVAGYGPVTHPTKNYYFIDKIIIQYCSGVYSKLDIFNMDYGSSQHIELIFEQKRFDKNI